MKFLRLRPEIGFVPPKKFAVFQGPLVDSIGDFPEIGFVPSNRWGGRRGALWAPRGLSLGPPSCADQGVGVQAGGPAPQQRIGFVPSAGAGATGLPAGSGQARRRSGISLKLGSFLQRPAISFGA